MNRSTPQLRHRGFTLVEMMVSMAIAAVILVTAAALLRSTGEGYERIGGSVSAEREARAFIGQLRSDMATAIHHAEAPFSDKDGVLAFLSLQPAAAQIDAERIGDVCAVNYRLAEIQIPGKVTRVLLRGFRNSAKTFDALAAGTTTQLFNADTDLDEPIAFGVVSYTTTPVIRTDTGTWQTWNTTLAAAPQAVDVKLVIARQDYAKRLRTAADWDRAAAEADNPKNLKNFEIYETRIRFGHHDAS